MVAEIRVPGASQSVEGWDEVEVNRSRHQRLEPVRGLRATFIVGSLVASIVGSVAAAGLTASPVVAASGYDVHQGIDSCAVPSVTQMDWAWSHLPVWSWGIYLGGATARGVGCRAWTSSEMTSARTIGWGFMPIWDDLQAPCNTNMTYHISTNTTTAFNQGVTSAVNAGAAMTAAGFLSYDQVWLDIEAYAAAPGCTGSALTTSRAAVNAYVDGWSSQLGGDSGVYGSSQGSYADDWSTIAHHPAEVWLAAWDLPSANPNTVWGIPGVVNGHRSNDQRVHQYRHHIVNYSVVGNSTNRTGSYDVDCLDGWLDGGLPWDNDGDEGTEINSVTAEPLCLGATQ
ncbi:MAG TPA: glycoside hydrolase domain-containing protein [Propionicimonas sp.]